MENEIQLSLIDTVEMMDRVSTEIYRVNMDKCGDGFPYKAVVSIAEGGVPFGKFVESKLWAQKHLRITIQFRDENRNIMKRPKTKGITGVLKMGTPILLVDDIIDSGTTIEHFQKASGYMLGNEFDLATLHWCKELSPNIEPTFFHSLKKQNDWIVYPWERPLGFDEVWELALL